MSFTPSPDLILANTLLVLFQAFATHLGNYMASAQVDVAQVEEFEKTLGSPTIEGSTKAPVTSNIESPYDDDEEDLSLPDELGKEEDEDDDGDEKAVAPQIIKDEDEDEDEKAQDEEPMSKSVDRATDFSEEEGEEDD